MLQSVLRRPLLTGARFILGGSVALPLPPANVFNIATSAILPLNRQASTSTSNNRMTAKFFRNGRKAVTKVRLRYANAYLNSAGAEASDLGASKIWAAVKVGSTYYPVTFGGAASASLAAGAEITSDVVAGLDLPAGAGFLIITCDQVTATQYRPTQYYLATSRGEGYAASGTEATILSYLTGATALPVNGDGWTGLGPYGVMAEAADGSQTENVVVLHDSIGDGTAEVNAGGDANGNRGYIRRAFADAGFYCWTLGRAGGTLANCVPSNSPIRAAAFGNATSFIDQLAENSLTVTNVHTVYEEHIDLWKGVKNVPAIAAQVLPKTDSTDNWMTKAGQTVQAANAFVSVITALRPRFNLRIHQRDMLARGKLAGIIDGLPYVVSPTAPDMWNSPAETASGRLTNDAIHPTELGHIALKSAVASAIASGVFNPTI